MAQFSEEHRRKLSEAAKRRWQDPEYCKEMASIVITDEGRKAISDSMKARWQDSEYKKNHPKVNLSESARRSISEKAKKRWSDPIFKSRVTKKIGKTAKEVWERPGYKEKMSESLRGCCAGEKNHMWGKKLSIEGRKKLSEAHKGIQAGENHPMFGKHHSNESKQKMSESHNDYQSGEGHPMFGRHHSEDSKAKIIAAHLGIPLSEEHKKKIGKASKRVWATIDEEKKKVWRQKIGDGNKGKIISKESREKLSKAHKKLWENPEHAKKCLVFNSPNKCETKLMNLLDKIYPGEWKFVGDGQVVIDGKCPDFININGRKQIIELYGERWHQDDDPQDRINVFKPFGYDTLIIWVKELSNKKRLERTLVTFCQGDPNFLVLEKGGCR